MSSYPVEGEVIKSFLRKVFPVEPIFFRLNGSEDFETRMAYEVFGVRKWPEVSFPAESGAITRCFGTLDAPSKLYYFPSYAANAIENYYYRSGCVSWVVETLAETQSRFSRPQLDALEELLRFFDLDWSVSRADIWKAFKAVRAAKQAGQITFLEQSGRQQL